MKQRTGRAVWSESLFRRTRGELSITAVSAGATALAGQLTHVARLRRRPLSLTTQLKQLALQGAFSRAVNSQISYFCIRFRRRRLNAKSSRSESRLGEVVSVTAVPAVVRSMAERCLPVCLQTDFSNRRRKIADPRPPRRAAGLTWMCSGVENCAISSVILPSVDVVIHDVVYCRPGRRRPQHRRSVITRPSSVDG